MHAFIDHPAIETRRRWESADLLRPIDILRTREKTSGRGEMERGDATLTPLLLLLLLLYYHHSCSRSRRSMACQKNGEGRR